MIIFWRLLLGHFLADFTFQTDRLHAWKRRNLAGMSVHCAMHPILYAVLTWPFLGQYWVNTPWVRLQGWVCILIIFILHFLEDEWRIFTISRYRTPDNTVYFLWDQFIHYASIFVFLPIGLFDMSDGWFPEKWPVLGVLAVIVTHFSTVLVYFLEKDIWGGEFPGADEKYLAMLMRFVLALCCLLPGSWWIVPVILWIISLFYLRYKRVVDFSWFSLDVGGAICLACGIAARVIWYS